MTASVSIDSFRSRPGWAVFGIMFGAIVIVCLAPFFGATKVPFVEVVSGTIDETIRHIVFDIRIPRVVIGFITGGALGLGGLIFQTVFRNVLATPYTLGVSSGASLGVAVYLKCGVVFSLVGLPGSAWAAFLGAVAVVFFIDRVAARGASTTTVLLTGVVVSVFAASLISCLEYLSSFTAVAQLSRWVMGGLESVSFAVLWPVLPLILWGGLVAVWHAADLDILALGDEVALGRGVDVPVVRRRLLFATSVMIGGVVSFAGPIGFVGIVVPHALRLVLGYSGRLLVPASVVCGGAFLVVCDTIARTVAAPYEVPVGIATALVGGPYFLWLLLGSGHTRR